MRKRTISFILALMFVLPTFAVFSAANENESAAAHPGYYGRDELAKLPDAGKLLYVYDQIEEAVRTYAPEAIVFDGEHLITREEVDMVMKIFCRDYSQYFWMNGAYVVSFNSSTVTSVSFKYTVTEEKLEAAKAAFDEAVEGIVSGIEPGMTELDIELYLHDRLAATATYDREKTTENRYDAYGALVEGHALCQGYSAALQVLLYRVGIPSFVIRGRANNGSHSWNYAMIDGNWYHCDVTFDDPFDKNTGVDQLRHSNFNMSDEICFENHTVEELGIPLPVCSSTDAYYKNIKSVRLGRMDVIPDFCFREFSSLESIVIPDRITKIGDYAFAKCGALRSVRFGENVESIGAYAFLYCTSLETLVFGGRLKSIGTFAFYGCSGITEIFFPKTLKTVDNAAFYDCVSLKTVFFKGTKDDWNKIDIKNDSHSNRCLLGADIVCSLGDQNGDGKLNARDIIILMRLIVSPNAPVTPETDLNGDGKVNARDVILLMKLIIAAQSR